MAQIIVPTVDLQLNDQYAQHYNSDISIPFKIDPAQSLKPMADVAEAYAQFNDRMVETETTTAAQEAVNEFNEYKLKRLTDLSNLPLSKAVNAYQGFDPDLERKAKETIGKLSNEKVKQKASQSISTSLSDGRARGYGLHAEQVVKHEAQVDGATIDTAAQDTIGSIGTPAFNQKMEEFHGVVDTIGDKQGLSAEEKLSSWREQSQKVYLTGGSSLIEEKKFGAVGQMLHDHDKDMDQYTKVQLRSRLNAAMLAEAEHQAALAREARNQAISEIKGRFTAAKSAGNDEEAAVWGKEMDKYDPYLSKYMVQEARLQTANTLVTDITSNGIIGADSQEQLNALSHLITQVAPEQRNGLINTVLINGDKQTTLERQAEQQAKEKRISALKENFERSLKNEKLDKAGNFVIDLYKEDPVQGDLYFDTLEKKDRDMVAEQLKAQLGDDKELFEKYMQADDYDNTAKVIQRIYKQKPELAQALLGVMNADIRTKVETRLAKADETYMANVKDYIHASKYKEAYQEAIKTQMTNPQRYAARIASMSADEQTALEKGKKEFVTDQEKLFNNYVKAGDLNAAADVYQQVAAINPALAKSWLAVLKKEQKDEIAKRDADIKKQTNELVSSAKEIVSNYEEAGKYKEAAQYVARVEKLNPELGASLRAVLGKKAQDALDKVQKQEQQNVDDYVSKQKEIFNNHLSGENIEGAYTAWQKIDAIDHDLGLSIRSKLTKKERDLMDAQEEKVKKQSQEFVSTHEKRMNNWLKAEKFEEAKNEVLEVAKEDPEGARSLIAVVAKENKDFAKKLETEAEKTRKEQASLHRANIDNFLDANNFDKVYEELAEYRKYDPEGFESLRAKVAEKQAQFGTELQGIAVDNGDKQTAEAAARNTAQASTGLSGDENLRHAQKQLGKYSQKLVDDIKATAVKDLGSAMDTANRLLKSEYATEADKNAIHTWMNGIKIDDAFNQIQNALDKEDYASVGAALYTTDENGNRVRTKLGNRLAEADPSKFLKLDADYTNGNIKANDLKLENIKKHKGLSDAEEKKVAEDWLNSFIPSATDTYFKEHGIENPTDYQRKTIEAKLRKDNESKAYAYADKVSKEVWAANTAEGHVYMATQRDAEVAFNKAMFASDEARQRGLTTTNPFSIISQEEQNALLKRFDTKEKQQEFIDDFNRRHTNLAQGNPQTHQRVLLDIKAGKYDEQEASVAMRDIVTKHTGELSVDQFNAIETELKERAISLNGNFVDSMYSNLRAKISRSLGYGDYSKLKDGSEEQSVVMNATAKMLGKLKASMGYDTSANGYQLALNNLFVSGDYASEINIIQQQNETQERITEGWKSRVKEAVPDEGTAQASGIDGARTLYTEAARRGFHYPLTYAGYQQYVKDNVALAGWTNTARVEKKGKELFEKYATKEQKEQFRIDRKLALQKLQEEHPEFKIVIED